MESLLKRYLIKVPKSVSVFYCNEKKILLARGVLGQKLLKLDVRIKILNPKKIIQVTNKSFTEMDNKNKKKMDMLRGTAVALIKKMFLEISTNICKKLKLTGVGFRIFLTKKGNIDLMRLKLGYSHDIYFKIPKNIKIREHKSTKIFISGNCYEEVAQTAAKIRKFKIPEPYKGKGISYDNEIIVLKEGKKI